MATRGTFCDGLQRRDFLRVGSAGLFGGMWPLSSLLASAPNGVAGGAESEKSLILVFLRGGLSHIDTWDLKPEAPSEFRGEFKPISTNVPGTQISEFMPRTSQHMDKIALLRSFTHLDSTHVSGDHYVLTGYRTIGGFAGGLSFNNQFPSHGSILSKWHGPRGSVPPYVCVPDPHPSCGAAYLGPTAAPFSVNADPNEPGFTVRDVAPPLDVDPRRLEARQEILARLDRFQKGAEARANRGAESASVFRRKAFELMTSSTSKHAFDIQQEPEGLRDEYGRNTLGQSCLMARRLVEAGVRCVTVHHVDWDTHEDNFVHLQRDLLPLLDASLSTLFRDLADRGLLDTTLVVVASEMGRTPRINDKAGGDHWSQAYTIAMGGGGIRGGVVVGKTDERAEKPAEDPHGPEDLAATIHHLMGVDPNAEFHTPEGRPVKIVNDGRVIRGLLS